MLIDDHVGPAVAKEGARALSENGAAANDIVRQKLEHLGKRALSSLYWTNVLALTSNSDLPGSLELALRLRGMLDDALIDYDAAGDHERFVAALDEELQSEVNRLLERRRYIQRLIQEFRSRANVAKLSAR
jgi:hypothetical protein